MRRPEPGVKCTRAGGMELDKFSKQTWIDYWPTRFSWPWPVLPDQGLLGSYAARAEQVTARAGAVSLKSWPSVLWGLELLVASVLTATP